MGQAQAASTSSPDAIPPPPQFMPFPSSTTTPREDEKATETAKSSNPGDLETLTKRVKGTQRLHIKCAHRTTFRNASTAIRWLQGDDQQGSEPVLPDHPHLTNGQQHTTSPISIWSHLRWQ